MYFCKSLTGIRLNIITQAIYEQKPKDSFEASLCAQAMTLYMTAMRYLRRSENSFQSEKASEIAFMFEEKYMNFAANLDFFRPFFFGHVTRHDLIKTDEITPSSAAIDPD